MAGDIAGKSFQDVLTELGGVHDRALACQRELYEKRLGELHHEIELLRGRLCEADGSGASLAQSVCPFGIEVATEGCHAFPWIGSRTGGNAGLGAVLRTAACTAPGSLPQAASPKALADGPAASAAPGSPPLPARPRVLAEGPVAPARGPAVEHPGPSTAGNDPAAVSIPPPGVCVDNGSCRGRRWLWEIIGGKDKGGIFVREGESTGSAQFATRLCTGTLVEQVELNGARLHFKRLTGAGPKEGWISTNVQGKDLAVRAGRPPLKPRQPPPLSVGPNSEEPLPIALLFPGSGIALEESLFMHSDSHAVREILDKARSISSLFFPMYSLEQLIFKFAGVGNFIGSMITLEEFKDRRPEVVTRASAMAGFGTGQYTALCVAGALPFETGLILVLSELQAYSEVKHADSQLMVEVKWLEYEKLQPLCLRACQTEAKDAVCEITGFVASQRHWVAGTKRAVALVMGMAKKAGAQVEVISHIAFNTMLMGPAVAKLMTGLDKALPFMKPPLNTVWMSATAEPLRPGCDPMEIVDQLRAYITNPMLAFQCTDAMKREGVSGFYCIMPGAMQYTPIEANSAAEWMDLWYSHL